MLARLLHHEHQHQQVRIRTADHWMADVVTDEVGYVAMQLAALAAVASGDACPWPSDEHWSFGHPWATPASRYESVQVLLVTSRERFLAAWKRLESKDQLALRSDGVFGAPPPVPHARIRFRVAPGNGFQDIETGTVITPEEVAAYCAARHAGRTYVSRTEAHALGVTTTEDGQIIRPVFGQPLRPERRERRERPGRSGTLAKRRRS